MQNSQGENFLNQVNQVEKYKIDDSKMLTFFDNEPKPLQTAFKNLPSGKTKPKGWLLNMMQNDLETGMVGALDELYPGIKKDDLYFTARRGGIEDIPEMGDLVLKGDAWETSIMWWNAETIGNWWDGFVRHAFLTENKEAIQQSHQIVDNLLQSQDDNGYIGIYKENLRYQHKGSNGELWAQTTAFRMLLAYYEFTENQDVLKAIEKGMAVTMKNYSEGANHPFDLENAFGGVTHGLMMTDVCETLHRITGKKVYQDYATYLYKAFSTYSINRSFNDLRYPFLLDKDSLFIGHAAHTYEHFRSLVNAYYHTGYPELKAAFDNALYKLEKCLLPSGAGHGNEWIAALEADPTYTTSEYCPMLELRNSFSSIFQKTGELLYADRAEKLTFNGLMGARNQDGTAITYGKGDNCFVLDGQHHGQEETHKDPRYKYSPTHSEPAVCCAPNYSRNLSYYLDQMWLKKPDGLVAAMYGPSELNTSWKNQKVKIIQQTNYPFSDQITFKIYLEKPAEFALYFRKPQWTEDLKVIISVDSITEEDGFVKVVKEWQNEDQITITFKQQVQKHQLPNQEVFFQRGPLVFAYAIPHKTETIKNYPNSSFTDYYCLPTEHLHEKLFLHSDDPEIKFDYQELPLSENPWYQALPKLKIQTAKQGFELIPMGSTVLRRVSFPIQ